MTAPAATQQSGPSLLELAAGARTVQLMVRTALLRDVTRLWPALDPQRLNATFPGWLRAMAALVGSYHRQSATAAGRYYQLARASAIQTPTPASLIRLAPPPAEQWMTSAFGYAGPGMLSRDETRPGTALSTTLGTASRIALDGGRQTVAETIKHDRVAVGWYRIADGDPCSFCAMVASRGIVYKNEQEAGRAANRKFVGFGEFKYHNSCGCSAAPAFSHDQELPEVSRIAADVYDQHARGERDQLNAFRRAWEARQAEMADPAA